MKNKNKFLLEIFSVIILIGGIVNVVNAAPPVCGNLICEVGEDTSNCVFDCNPCGDGTCDAGIGETPLTCSDDCSGSVCGDGTCEGSEDYESCQLDCTTLPDPQPDPGSPSPSCEDVIIHVGEQTTCSIKVENIATFPLINAMAQVTIPKKITKVNNTNSWSCMSTAEGVKCQKAYSPYLIMGEVEYLELILTTDTEGQYSLAATISGEGKGYNKIVYNTSEEITVTNFTADAVNDFFSYGSCYGRTITISVAGNDTLCSSGTTTFNFRNISDYVTVNSIDNSTGEINLDISRVGSLFDYDILCDGVVVDSAYAHCNPPS